jgi:DNA-binding response OmpR family regulator
MEKVLLIEDSLDSQVLVRRTLASRCRIDCAASGNEARSLLKNGNYDLILLDVSLPDVDGFSLIGEIRESREHAETPVVFLTGKSELTDKVLGFSLGADDYVVKPFEPLELRARIDAKLNLLQARRLGRESLRRGPFRIDLPSQRAYLNDGSAERELGLTPLEFKLLIYLARNEERVISREQLLESVWGGATHVLDRVIDRHVSTLRQKLGSGARCIETVPGSGYRFAFKTLPL